MEALNKEKGLLLSLLESANDIDKNVQTNVVTSITKIGLQNPDFVLVKIHQFCTGENPVKAEVLSLLYGATSRIICECEEKIEEDDIVLQWIQTCESVILSPKSSSVLVEASSEFLRILASAKLYLSPVMLSLTDKLKSDEQPNQDILVVITSIVSSNSRESAIYFRPVMSKLLPLLSSTVHDNLRLSMASMFAKFSEGVVDAMANKTSEDQITLEEHNETCSLVCDVLLSQWVKSANVKVRNEVLLCVSHMCYLLSAEKLESYSATLVANILANYKRNPSPFTISSSMALFCDAAIKSDVVNCLKGHVESILGALFSQVCATPNFNEPLTVKNHCEVLRCFDFLARSFPDVVVSMLIQRLENASHVQRVGSLLVVKHLVNGHSISSSLAQKVIAVMVNHSLSDPNSKVVRTLAQVIVSLCHNGYLDSSTGHPFITFLVKHSAGGTLESRRMTSLTEVGEEFVGNVCYRALNVLATSIKTAGPLLWPSLLHYVTKVEYQSSFPTILSSLSSLLANQSEQINLIQEPAPFTETGDTSLPYVFSHLLLMASSPKLPTGLSALSILQHLPRPIYPDLVDVWREHLPQLKETFTASSSSAGDPSSVEVWQDSLRDFLRCSLEKISNERFTSAVIASQLELLEVWEKNQGYKCFLMSIVGVPLRLCNSASTIDATLTSLYSYVHHKSPVEQEAFGLCLGICAQRHMNVTLSHVESWSKDAETVKRSSLSLFYLMKSQDGRSEDAMWVKSTIVLSLGFISHLAPPEILAFNVDGPIMLQLLNIINSNKSDFVNEVALQTLSKTAKALLSLPDYELRQRPLLLTHVVNSIKQDSSNCLSTLLISGLQVLRDLSALKPELNVEERTIVLQASLGATFSYLLQKNSSLDDSSCTNRCYAQLNVLIRTIIQRDPCPATLDDVTTLLHSWILSPMVNIRVKSLDLLYSSFATFLQYIVLSHAGPTSFNQTCQLLSMLSPRLSDPSHKVRSLALGSLKLLLKITCRYNGHGPQYLDEDTENVKAIECDIKQTSTKEELKQSLDVIAKVICNKLSFVQLRSYLSLVMSGLQDSQEGSSGGVAHLLTKVFAIRGHQFHQHIPELLDSLYGRLEKVSFVETRRCCIEAVCNLAKHNVNAVIETLLNYPLPFEGNVRETLQRIGCEADLCASSLTHYTQILERSQFFVQQENASQEKVRMASLPTLSAVCSVKELLRNLCQVKMTSDSPSLTSVYEEEFEVTGSRQIVNERLPSLVALLLLAYGSYVETVAPLYQSSDTAGKMSFVPNRNATLLVPSKCALECLQVIASVSGCERLLEALSSELLNPNCDTVDDFLQALSTISILFAEEVPNHVSSLVAYLDTHHNHEIQRMTVASVFGELIGLKCCGDFELLEIVTSGLLSKLNDKSPQVRRLVVRGISNFARLQTEELSDKMNEVVSALVTSTDLREGNEAHTESQVALEALRGMASLLPHLPTSLVVQHTPTLLIRVRMFVEKNNSEIREASIGVLRGLSTSVGETEEFRDHLHLHLLSTIIHLEDPHPPMVVMCKSALRSLGSHFCDVEGLGVFFEQNLILDEDLDLVKFIDGFCSILVQSSNDKIGLFLQISSSYFRHSEAGLRRASILTAGYLVHHSTSSEVSSSLPRVYHGLVHLLRDPDPTVRSTAASVVPLVAKCEKLL